MNQVWAVYRNNDMNEGRGPMVLDKVFAKKEDAIEYMNSKDGVQGRSAFYTNHVTAHKSEGWHDKEAWPYGGDWEVRELQLNIARWATEEPISMYRSINC